MRWASYWMIGMSVFHCAMAVMVYCSTFDAMLSKGAWGAAETDAEKLALWFLVSGMMILMIGLLLRTTPNPPAVVGALLFATALFGAVLIPISGFWLLFPPALGIALSGKL